MKNMKIGFRISMGFSVVIGLLLIIGIVVVSTNLSTINNVDRIDMDSALQTSSNSILEEFNQARIQANILYTTISEEANESYRRETADISKGFTEIHAFLDTHDRLEQFRPSISVAEEYYEKWRVAVEEVIAMNDKLDEDRAIIYEYGAKINEVSELLLESQLNLIDKESSSGAPLESIARRSERARLANDMEQAINAFRMDVRVMLNTFDTSSYDAVAENMDKAIALAEEYRNGSAIPEDRENAQRVIDTVAEYKVLVTEFAAQCELCLDSVSAARPLGDASIDALHEALEALNVTVDNQISSTTAASNTALILVVLITLISIVTAVFMAIKIMRSITVPVEQIVSAADSIALGDVDVAIEFESRDELGELADSFRKMADAIKIQVEYVGKLAEGDLTFDVEVRSEKDAMNMAILDMTKKMNITFQNIRSSSNQVASGSHQIAQASQNLASGSTEQAATIQQFSAAISEVQNKAEAIADIAGVTLVDVQEAGVKMGECTQAMDQMLQAMTNIDESSQNISKVIKVIDDIAFQTNILALNAAVEAARAGQHGKGFAVVADEVRNLASKSAAAAKETAALIENSLQSVSEGNNMVGVVNVSLQAVGEIAARNLESISQMDHASKEQSTQMVEITSGITQLSAVVQANSATAEETAASSEEMSAQASVLDGVIAQFKLRSPDRKKKQASRKQAVEQSLPALTEMEGKPALEM